MATIILKGSLGAGKAKGGRPHNDPDDFRKIRNRFVELGYKWVGSISSGSDKAFVRAIKLFQCICAGATSPQEGRNSKEWKISKWKSADGRIDPGGNTHNWLVAENAPGWTTIKSQSGAGWRCTNDLPASDNYFTTTWMLDPSSGSD